MGRSIGIQVHGRKCFIALFVLLLALFALLPAPAGATYPGRPGRIAWAYDAADSNSAQPDFGVVTVASRPGGCLTTSSPAVCADHPVVSCKSGAATTCAEYTHVSYSPNGRRLAWAISLNGGSEIVLANGNGTNQSIIDRGTEKDLAPSFSPSGNRLLFVRILVPGGPHQIVTGDLHAAHQRLITSVTGDNPAWSPDGRQILFEHGSAIWVVRANGHGARLLIRNAQLPDWSPDGRKIVYIGRSDLRMHTARADGTGRRAVHVSSANVQLQPLGRQPDAQYAVWSPGGRRIAFAGTDDSGAPEICVVPAGGGRARVIDSFGTNIAGVGTVGLTWQSR